MDIRINRTMPRDFVSLMLRSGNEPKTAIAATAAIRSSLFTVGIYQGDVLMAFGRVIGDDALYYIVCDVMVDRRYRDRNLEMHIAKEIDDYIRELSTKDSNVFVMAEKPLDDVFRRFGFKYLDDDFRCVMTRK